MIWKQNKTIEKKLRQSRNYGVRQAVVVVVAVESVPSQSNGR